LLLSCSWKAAAQASGATWPCSLQTAADFVQRDVTLPRNRFRVSRGRAALNHWIDQISNLIRRMFDYDDPAYQQLKWTIDLALEYAA
jgi:hypothetical protein